MTKEEALARAICKAAGDDPDAKILLVKDLARTKQGWPILLDGLRPIPGWALYRGHAQAALESFELNPDEQAVDAPMTRSAWLYDPDD